jgi:hypothetical protein
MRGENFVAHLDGFGGTPMCRGTPVAHHWSRLLLLRQVLHHFTAAVRVQHLPQVEHSRMQEDILNPDFSALHEGCS